MSKPAAKRLKFGIAYGDTLTWADVDTLSAALDDAKSLGVRWIRVDLAWCDIQPDNASTYLWSRFDRIVRAARSRGLSVMPTIGYPPSWARPAGATSQYWSPAHPSQFAAFASAAVRRYAPLGVHTWEICNEPNATFWAPKPDPRAYVRLLKVTVSAMRRCDRHVFIVSGGLAPVSRDATHIPALQYLAKICALGANRVVNAIGYHPYSWPVTPQNPVAWNAWAQIATTKSSVRKILAKYGTPSLPIWATEYGAPTNGPGSESTAEGYAPSPTGAYYVSESFHATLAADAVKAAVETPGVAALFWYSYRDLGTSANTRENFFGLRRANGTAKPAFYALRTAIRKCRVH